MNCIVKMDRGFKLKQLHKFGTLIKKIKIVGLNLNHNIIVEPFYVIKSCLLLGLRLSVCIRVYGTFVWSTIETCSSQ